MPMSDAADVGKEVVGGSKVNEDELDVLRGCMF